MCLIVEIRANEKIIETLVATNISPTFIDKKGKRLKYGKGNQVYETKLGLIEHKFEDGALVLAKKMIKQKLI
jgi:hypothetical protein